MMKSVTIRNQRCMPMCSETMAWMLNCTCSHMEVMVLGREITGTELVSGLTSQRTGSKGSTNSDRFIKRKSRLWNYCRTRAVPRSILRRGLTPPPKQKKPLNGAFLFWDRVWAFEPCSTNRPKPVGDAAALAASHRSQSDQRGSAAGASQSHPLRQYVQLPIACMCNKVHT